MPVFTDLFVGMRCLCFCRSAPADGSGESVPSKENQSAGAVHHGLRRSPGRDRFLARRDARRTDSATASRSPNHNSSRYSFHHIFPGETFTLPLVFHLSVQSQ